ncbi:CinA family nicotinamide mononucleotide deamidase-related protein [Deinococcus psychrotolerans]|uniref:CinA family nicotinamide mononucleotide deamidase-related protein n=1 Tax=Deinococcus psychrotolerans TaxID=2489213 RepID=UPI001F155B9D|nr:CinA family nicotinamide mononucleotide deamidase-related protein [Deinococcus psychrotolerans]
MKAEIISVGTELLLGEIVDTNAAFVARELSLRGVTLQRKATVGDNLERISGLIRESLSRADLVILGGGLGPTDDDLTREGIAAVARETPAEDRELLAWLSGLFTSRGRTMAPINRKQAWLIPSASALPNPLGTAPGWFVTLPDGHEFAGKRIAALPGPPREMNRMFREELLPRLNLPAWAFYAVTLHTSGIGESDVATHLGDLTKIANPSVATYARKTGTDVRVAASAKSAEEARQLAEPVLEQARTALGRYIWAEEKTGDAPATLAGAVIKLLAGRSLGLVEAGSGGTLALQFAGAAALKGAAISDDHATLLTLGLTPITLSRDGVCSEVAALELAHGARERFGTGVGLSVCAAAEGEQQGQVAIAIVGEGLERVASVNWPGDAGQVRERAASTALNLAFRALSAAEADQTQAGQTQVNQTQAGQR